MILPSLPPLPFPISAVSQRLEILKIKAEEADKMNKTTEKEKALVCLTLIA